MKMNIKTKDKVYIIAGKDKGKTGQVTKVDRENNRLVIEGVNVRTKRVKSRQKGEAGQVLSISLPVAYSNVLLFCSNCNRGVRIKKTEDKNGDKIRTCVKCEKVFK
ncbi:MAG: 50S ribosomal protein L24 [Patescibacteria group bacterium]